MLQQLQQICVRLPLRAPLPLRQRFRDTARAPAAWPACYRPAISSGLIFPTGHGTAILVTAGSPAMAINGYRNKPFGPGGGTRRLHHKLQAQPFPAEAQQTGKTGGF